MSKILVTGGTGYIGSHTLIDLIDNGFDVISADNFTNSDASSLKGVEAITGKKVKNYKVDLSNLAATRKIFAQNPDLSGVIHFAALKSVGDSVYNPLGYFQNNLGSLLNIVQCMTEFKIANLIFSSSCSVYGQSDQLPVTEETLLKPVESPYARTKVMGEEILRDFCFTTPSFNAILLRYFNPAGAHPSALIGENPSNIANNLVPVITETAFGKRPMMTVFGTDYPTRDGSCIRDYIHVMDIANAHVKAVQYLEQKKNKSNTETFNLGIGEGVSVLEAIKAFETVTQVDLNYRIGNKRTGDVGAVYADNTKATTLLGWKPKYGIDEIMQSAWAWEQKRNK
jgi:UDP-glucose 4-epimerase